MRHLTLVQDIAASVGEHWRVFFDDDFERALYDQHLRFPRYDLVDSRQTDDAIHRKIRVVPRLDAPAAVTKLLGSSFGYVEEGTFDRRAQVWRSRVIPNVLSDRIGADFVVRAEPVGDDRCRRTIDISIDVRIFGLGRLVESAFEKNLRDGWRESAAFLNEWVRRPRPPAS